MKRISLTVCATLIALMSYGQNAGQEFTMKPMEYVVIDDTPYGFARSGTNHTNSDISVAVALQLNKDKKDEQWRCKYGAKLDTLIVAIQKNDFMNGWRDVKTFPNGIAISDYLYDNHAKVIAEAETKITAYTNKLAELRKNKPWIDKQKQKEEELAALERENRYRIVGNMEYEFTEPTGPIQTKSCTNVFGAKVTYQYYVNENGYEVKHGKMTTTMTFKDHKYWTGLSKLGYVYVTGTETLTETYRNDILHGPLTYRCNVNTDATFSNPEKLNISYNLNVYKGFLNGNFKFEYNGITYTGKAVNGILEYCNYQTNDGFHGKLTSNPNSKSISVAEIDNGIRKFELGDEIKLPSIIAVMPTFRFPLIGK
ncbi:MAG: hypothetical protein LIO68_08255 [Rikenellaceae bacterium]|nr:hypothetical protein [Rikenellaceae bacterium]